MNFGAGGLIVFFIIAVVAIAAGFWIAPPFGSFGVARS
jgi:hypothetical protein